MCVCVCVAVCAVCCVYASVIALGYIVLLWGWQVVTRSQKGVKCCG